MYERVKTKGIICSGVSAGTTASVMAYLDAVVSLVKGQYVSGIDQHYFPSCERNGVDQGIHNVLVHLSIIPNTVTHVEDDGAATVVNMQASTSSYIRDDAVVMNTNGKVFSVVHQYDRSYKLLRKLVQRYAPSLFIEDPFEEWAATEACTNYKLIAGYDLFKGKCDFKILATLSPAACCSRCSETSTKLGDKRQQQQCQAFAFLEGICFLKSCESSREYVSTVKTAERDHAGVPELPGGFSAYSIMEMSA